MKLATIAVAIGAVATAALFAGAPYAFHQWVQARAAAAALRARHYAELHPKPASIPTAPAFTRVQVVTYLEHAQVAAAIGDPLKRCLAWPDPPGSHWNPAAVRAYCQYRTQPVLGMDEIRQLIESRQTAKLDALLAAALKAQETDPAARGRLDRIYFERFWHPSAELRGLLDAWKRQDPRSAFAYAASGVEYAQAADDARGADLITRTPAGNIASMDRLATIANADLQHALALKPRIVPVYRSMIMLGGIALGREYADAAWRKGTAIEPDDLALFDQRIWLEQPNWYGSEAAMDDLAVVAAGRAAANPLLALEAPQRRLYEIRQCDCTDAQTAGQYRAAAANLMGFTDLQRAGSAAQSARDSGGAGIYFSEALRFNPTDQESLDNLPTALDAFGFPQWALQVAERAVAAAPRDNDALATLGVAYAQVENWDAATANLRASLAIDPKNMWAWTQLGRVELQQCEWDAAGKIADREVRDDPTHSDGLELRAAVQAYQPQPGLADTAAALKQRFGYDAYVKQQVAAMERVVEQRNQARAQAAREHKPYKLQALPPPWFKQCKQFASVKLVPCPRQPPSSGSGHGHILVVCPAGAAP